MVIPFRRTGCRCALTAFFAVAATGGFAPEAEAHPHVWATVRSEILFDQEGQIAGVRHAWTFDEFYTAMAVQGLDTDGNGSFSAEELKPLAQVNIDSLKEFDYFTFVHSGDNEKLPLKPPENYSLDYGNGLLTLNFTLSLATPLKPSEKTLEVDVYDPSFFVAFGFATEAPVKMSGSPGCTAEIEKPNAADADVEALGEAFFSQLGPNSNFGSQYAQTVLIKCAHARS